MSRGARATAPLAKANLNRPLRLRAWVWFLAALDPDDPDRAYGLIDPGTGIDRLQLGTVRLSELAQWQNCLGCKVVRDPWFRARGVLSDYRAAAYAAGFVVG